MISKEEPISNIKRKPYCLPTIRLDLWTFQFWTYLKKLVKLEKLVKFEESAFHWMILSKVSDTRQYATTIKPMLESRCGNLAFDIFIKIQTWEFSKWKCPFISIHIGPVVSFTLGWVGDVPGIIQYMIWFEEQTWMTYFLQHFVGIYYFYSTKLFEKLFRWFAV